MKIRVYADPDTAAELREAIKDANGHCPCVLRDCRNETNKCMCQNFLNAPAGTICHCGLYIKEED